MVFKRFKYYFNPRGLVNKALGLIKFYKFEGKGNFSDMDCMKLP